MNNTELPLISIIVPVYNAERFLRRCIESIVNQTYTKLEILLIDDGSNDSSGKLCDEWAEKDHRIKVIHSENGGASCARNIGLSRASGELIGFVDSDDYISADMYEYLYALLKSYDADIAACAFTRNSYELSRKKKENITCCEKKDIMKVFFRIDGQPSNYSIWNKLYRRSVVENIRFREGIITEDVAFSYEALKKANLVVLSNLEKYVYYKNSKGVTQSRLCKKDLGLFQIWDEIVSEETEYKDMAILNRKRATFTLYVKNILYGHDNTISDAIIKEWGNEIRNNYTDLMQGKFLNMSRKAICFAICKFKL